MVCAFRQYPPLRSKAQIDKINTTTVPSSSESEPIHTLNKLQRLYLRECWSVERRLEQVSLSIYTYIRRSLSIYICIRTSPSAQLGLPQTGRPEKDIQGAFLEAHIDNGPHYFQEKLILMQRDVLEAQRNVVL